MNKSDAISLMSVLLSAVMGPNKFGKSSEEFQGLVLSSAEMIEPPGMELLNAISETTVGPLDLTDCEKLRILKAAIDQAVYELCDTCRPTDPTGPAVCSPGMFINPNEKGLME